MSANFHLGAHGAAQQRNRHVTDVLTVGRTAQRHALCCKTAILKEGNNRALSPIALVARPAPSSSRPGLPRRKTVERLHGAAPMCRWSAGEAPSRSQRAVSLERIRRLVAIVRAALPHLCGERAGTKSSRAMPQAALLDQAPLRPAAGKAPTPAWC